MDLLAEAARLVEERDWKAEASKQFGLIGTAVVNVTIVQLFLNIDPEPALAQRARLLQHMEDLHLGGGDREQAEERMRQELTKLLNCHLMAIQREFGRTDGEPPLCHCQMSMVPAWHKAGHPSGFDIEAAALGIKAASFLDWVIPRVRQETPGLSAEDGSLDREVWRRLPLRLRGLVAMPVHPQRLGRCMDIAMQGNAATAARAESLRAMQRLARNIPTTCSPLAHRRPMSAPRVCGLRPLAPVTEEQLKPGNRSQILGYLVQWTRSVVSDLVPQTANIPGR